MTIAAGILCTDGFVLCADSLETDGVTKRFVDKIWSYQVAEEWGVGIASAGEADLADSFNDGLRDVLGKGDFDEVAIQTKIRRAILETRRTYPGSQLAMIIGIFGPTGTRKIYRVADGSEHLGPVRRYEALGLGSYLAKFILSQLHSVWVTVDEAIRLGVFTIARCNEHVDGCDGPISILACKVHANQWLYEHPEYVEKIEKELPPEEFRRNLIDFWKAKHPSLERWNIVDPYRNDSTGGFVRLVHTAKIPERDTVMKSRRLSAPKSKDRR